MTDKVFFLGLNPTDIIGEKECPNGTPIQIDTSGYPPVTVTIHNWENCSLITKTEIIALLTAKGYVEQ